MLQVDFALADRVVLVLSDTYFLEELAALAEAVGIFALQIGGLLDEDTKFREGVVDIWTFGLGVK